MKHASLIIIVFIMAACGASRESGVVAHGMKWSIAQRGLEQNGWVIAVAKPTPRVFHPGNGAMAYRYANAKGEVVDFTTERVGEIEKVDRIFDGDGRELPEFPCTGAAAR